MQIILFIVKMKQTNVLKLHNLKENGILLTKGGNNDEMGNNSKQTCNQLVGMENVNRKGVLK